MTMYFQKTPAPEEDRENNGLKLKMLLSVNIENVI